MVNKRMVKSHEMYDSDSPVPPNKKLRNINVKNKAKDAPPAPAPAGMLTCDECGKFYKNTNSLRVHKSRNHKHDFIM